MNNLSTILKYSTTLLAFSLIGSPVSAAEITCTQNKNCASIGYDKSISDCVGDILKCPFDTNLANCEISKITPEQICKQKITDLGYSSDIDATKGTVVLYKSLTAETVQPRVKYISAAKLGIAECSSFTDKPVLTLTGKTIELTANKFNSIDIKLAYFGSGAEVNGISGTNYFAHLTITDNTGGSGAIFNLGSNSVRSSIYSGQSDEDYRYDDPVEKKSGGNITYGFKRGINIINGSIGLCSNKENIKITGDLTLVEKGSVGYTTYGSKLEIGGTLSMSRGTVWGTSVNGGYPPTNSIINLGGMMLYDGSRFSIYNADLTISPKTSYVYPGAFISLQNGKGNFADFRVTNSLYPYSKFENYTMSGKFTRF